jgi:hypothetical protein
MHATGAFISGIYHITPTELSTQFDFEATMNGFGNRIIFIYAERSKLLSNPGRPHADEFAKFVPRLARAIEFARGIPPAVGTSADVKGTPPVGEMFRDPQAEALWDTLYVKLLTKPRTGRQHNAMCARARAHVLRLSMLYALLDGSAIIKREHVHRAFCLWEYAEHTSRNVFGNSVGDKHAERILTLLREAGDAGMTTRDIIAKSSKKGSVSDALRLLYENRQIRVLDLKRDASVKIGGSTHGQRWFIR